MCPGAYKRPKASRTPRKSRPSYRESRMKMHDLPDSHGHFGPYGGIFVAETLIQALDELRIAYEKYRSDPEFIAEFRYDLKHLSLIHISEPTRLGMISYAVF